MSWGELLRDTVHTLWAHKLRTFLTMFGIAWGIVSIVLMVAAGEGFRVGQRQVAEKFGKDIMIVFAGRTSMQAGGTRAGRRLRWQATDHISVAAQSPACEHVLPELGQSDIPVKSAYNSGSFRVTGSLPPFAEIRSLTVGTGRYYNWDDVEEARRVAFLGSEVKEQLFAGRRAVGETLLVGQFPYTVIGVMQHKDQDSSYDGRDITKVFIPFSRMRRDFPEPPPSTPFTVDRLLVTPKSLEQHETCKWQVRQALARIHDFDPRDKEAAGVWDTIENAKAFRTMTDGMKYFMGAIGIVTLFLGGIGVMNIMLVSVKERTREIGVRKAVGASSRSILEQFFAETALLVFLSGGLGMGVAYGFCALINAAVFSRMTGNTFFAGFLPTWTSGLLAFALLGTTAILAALYPAGRAAAIQPIEALRYEPGG